MATAPSSREFRTARLLTRHSAAEVAKALGVSRSTVSRWESGQLEPPADIYDWLCRNRNQYASQLEPLSAPGEPRGQSHRGERARELAELRELKGLGLTPASEL